jgi:hypothetical protein
MSSPLPEDQVAEFQKALKSLESEFPSSITVLPSGSKKSMSAVNGLFNGNASKFLVAVATAVGSSYVLGHFDPKILATGLVGAVLLYLVPNKTVA